MNRLKRSKLFQIALFVVSALFLYSVYSAIIARMVTIGTLFLWLASMVLFYISFPFKEETAQTVKPLHNPKVTISACVIIFIAVAVRVVLMHDINTYHIDEYLSAHFSYSLPPLGELDWFGVYPPIGVWICQFPLFYFFFQKLFFLVFGLSTLSMRLSELPYIIGIFTFLFLIGRRLYNEKVGLTAITLLALFSPDLYITRWSLHFTSSTAFFLAATYFLVASIQTNKKLYFALFGTTLGLCYMTYYSSYIAAPLFILYIGALLITRKVNLPTLKNLILSAGIFLYSISPLFIYANFVDNFFTQRTEQVKLINGQWSPYQDVEINPQSLFEILQKQVYVSVEALYTDEVGGHAGYWFGKMAFFDIITFVVFIISIIYFLYASIRKRDVHKVFLLASVSAGFISGMVLTIPPPAFHRISVIYPFIALILAITLVEVYTSLKSRNMRLAFPIFITCLTLILAGNVFHFSKILVKDYADDIDFPLIETNLKEENVTKLYIASFESYSLGKVLFIRSNQKINALTKPLHELLTLIPKNETAYIIVVYPNEEAYENIKDNFKKVKLINTYERHALLKIN
jgi:hypothetical protein